jgi:hypothetical protein
MDLVSWPGGDTWQQHHRWPSLEGKPLFGTPHPHAIHLPFVASQCRMARGHWAQWLLPRVFVDRETARGQGEKRSRQHQCARVPNGSTPGPRRARPKHEQRPGKTALRHRNLGSARLGVFWWWSVLLPPLCPCALPLESALRVVSSVLPSFRLPSLSGVTVSGGGCSGDAWTSPGMAVETSQAIEAAALRSVRLLWASLGGCATRLTRSCGATGRTAPPHQNFCVCVAVGGKQDGFSWRLRELRAFISGVLLSPSS